MAPLPLVVLAPCVHGAAFAPGVEPDPPTGVVHTPVAPVEPAPPGGNGIRWRFAPWQKSGMLAVDVRGTSLDAGERSTSTMLEGQIDLASYLWQPWFAQVRLGAGVIVNFTQDSFGAGTDTTVSLNGRGSIALFPASRFPFELRGDLTDSRAGGNISLVGDYRSRRITMLQGWRSEFSGLSANMQIEHSAIDSGDLSDSLLTFDGTVLSQQGPHRVELTANYSDHQRDNDGFNTRIGTLTARHGYVPSSAIQVDTMASVNQVRLEGAGTGTGSEVAQLSTFANWRLPERGLAGLPGMPLITATARWIKTDSLGFSNAWAEALNATFGINHEVGSDWRFVLSSTFGHLRSPTIDGLSVAGVAGAVNWAPRLDAFGGGWRYMPILGLSAGTTHDEAQGNRNVVGAQASHTLTREYATSETSAATIGLTQGVAALRESTQDELLRGYSHGINLGWQVSSERGSTSYLTFSATDTRADARRSGAFQIINLQWSQRTSPDRYQNWSINLTAQATRNTVGEVDPFTGVHREVNGDWVPFYSAGASYDHQRFLGVPRLRLSLLASASSQVIERRAFGSIDAPQERVTESFEGRLEYSIGRLELRLAGRVGRVADETVAVFQARAQRRF